MGVECQPLCGDAVNVGNVQYQESAFLSKRIEKGSTLVDNKWASAYPWMRDAIDLPDNFTVAAAMLYSTAKRLLHQCIRRKWIK